MLPFYSLLWRSTMIAHISKVWTNGEDKYCVALSNAHDTDSQWNVLPERYNTREEAFASIAPEHEYCNICGYEHESIPGLHDLR